MYSTRYGTCSVGLELGQMVVDNVNNIERQRTRTCTASSRVLVCTTSLMCLSIGFTLIAPHHRENMLTCTTRYRSGGITVSSKTSPLHD